MTKITEKTNEELARTALGCLQELEFRGNKDVKNARCEVAFFHSNILDMRDRVKSLGELMDDVLSETE